jgi:hypothetical protein
VWRLVALQIRFGDSLEFEAVILCSRPGSGGGIRNAAKGATGDRRAGSVPLASVKGHRSIGLSFSLKYQAVTFSDFRYWHLTDMLAYPPDIRYRG